MIIKDEMRKYWQLGKWQKGSGKGRWELGGGKLKVKGMYSNRNGNEDAELMPLYSQTLI
jgi:hypothetical protein